MIVNKINLTDVKDISIEASTIYRLSNFFTDKRSSSTSNILAEDATLFCLLKVLGKGHEFLPPPLKTSQYQQVELLQTILLNIFK